MGFETAAVAGGAEGFDEFLRRQRLEVRHGRRGVTLRAHPGDETDFRADPSEGCPFPTGGINGAVAVHIEIGHAGQSKKFLLTGSHGGSLRSESVVINPVASPVGGEGSVVPAGGQTGFVDPGGPASRAPTVVGQRLDDLIAEILEEAWVTVLRPPAEVVEPNVPATPVIGVVPREAFEFRTQGYLQNIARAVGPGFQAAAVGAEPHHAPATQLQASAVGAHGFHEAKVADGRIQPTVDAQGQAVGSVVGRPVLEGPADAADQGLLLVGHPVPVLVDEHAHVGRVQQVEAVVIPDEPARRIHIRHEGLHLIALTVAIGVPHTQDTA